MTFNITLAPASEFVTPAKESAGTSELAENRAQFVEFMSEAILQSEDSGEALVLVVPLDGDTTIQNQLASVKRYAKFAAAQLGVSARVSKVRNENQAYVRVSELEADEAEATEGEGDEI